MSNAPVTAGLALDDPERIVEIVSAGGIVWETSGSTGEAGGWLGNATGHDREAIRLCARQVAAEGKALRISFPSVMTFLLGYDFTTRRYVISVPHDHDTSNGCCDVCGR